MVFASYAGRETLTFHITGRYFAGDGEMCVGTREYINDTSFIEPAGTSRTKITAYGQEVECEVFDRFGLPVTFFIITGSTQIDARIQFFGRFECDAVDVVGDVGVSMEYDVSNPPG